ncbi:MAG: M28 family peptidase [Candidatus Competibacteraceae bacterium]|nr:M28 family peptidase [Candidatus Competibacteraceae bacterium]
MKKIKEVSDKKIVHLLQTCIDMRKIFFLLFIVSYNSLFAQYLTNDSRKRIESHVIYLSSDELEGRLTGTDGEQKALDYIASQWKKAKITQAGVFGYSQSFDFTYRIEADASNYVKTGNKESSNPSFSDLSYYPVSGSGNGYVEADCIKVGYGIQTSDKRHDDYAGHVYLDGKVFIIDISDPDGGHSHSSYSDYTLQTRISKAIEKGASAIIFINPSGKGEEPSQTLSTRVLSTSIPVVFSSNHTLFKEDGFLIKMNIKLNRIQRTGHNVIGFIDNKASHTIAIGAHYDHLGYGDDGSLYKGERAIHNGADDNASGTALLIELGRYLKKSGKRNFNYLLIAFSGEELGLLGSSSFTKSPLFSNYSINYMFNMDMVGRLDSSSRTLLVNGVGTSPFWQTNATAIKAGNLHIKTTESGIGPSDHTSFYLKDIPVLHFFTGTHSDYHKPSDDWEKVNMDGIVDIGNYMIELINLSAVESKLAFTKTKEPENGKVSSFKVTLGVVPDYAYEGQGMRIDGVSEGKPAQIGGLKAGDIIIQIGEHKIKDIYAYMGSLSHFSKGQTTTIIYLRNGSEQSSEITF